MRQPNLSAPVAGFSHAVRLIILASGVVASWTILGLAGWVIFKLSPLDLY